MKSQIKMGGKSRLKRSATITDNAHVKRTLHQIQNAIQEGRMDDILDLKTYDVIDLGRDDGVKHTAHRTMSFDEIDKYIKDARNEKIDDVKFAHDQLNLFSQYLKKNVHAANNGYSFEMIMDFISTDDLYKFTNMILELVEKSKTAYIPGQYNNVYGAKETLLDHIVSHAKNKFEADR